MNKIFRIFATVICCCYAFASFSQGVTTGNLTGTILGEANSPLAGASVHAVHVPSGTKYEVVSLSNGQFRLSNLRVGGPYKITASYVGFTPYVAEDITVNLGETINLQVKMQNANNRLEEVVVSSNKSGISKQKTGSSTNISRRQIDRLPTINRSISDFTRLTPAASSAGFLGKGNKSGFVSIDGAAFNNSYGLGSETSVLPGNNSGAQPISLDAVEQIQVNLSPFDVRLGGFTGASINAVTRSGDNQIRGSVYDYFRNQNLVGTKAKDAVFSKQKFSQNTAGFRVGGPIIKNKLFFFVNYEQSRRNDPGTTIRAGEPGASGPAYSNIQASTLNSLSDFLKSQYNYDPGKYQDYDLASNSDNFLVKFDYSINAKNKLSVRYNYMNSTQDQGLGNSQNRMSFYNLSWARKAKVNSIVAELNSTLSAKASNRFFASYTSFPENRQYNGTLFPQTLIKGSNTINFGADAAANGNRINQKFLQIQDDYTRYAGKHTFTAGFSVEHFDFFNGFTFRPQGYFEFNSLDDFYNNAPLGTVTPTGISTGFGRPSYYEIRYATAPDKRITEVNPTFLQTGVYLQDEYKPTNNLKLTGGVRLDISSFISNPRNNPAIGSFTFQDINGQPQKFTDNKLPGTMLLVSPRIGFNWNVLGNDKLIIRGGSGLFSGRNPFTYVGGSFTQNGLEEGSFVVTRSEDLQNYRFSGNIDQYVPANKQAPSSYELDMLSSNYKLPQVWRSTLAADYRLPLGITSTLEVNYGKDFHEPFYYNANLSSQDAGGSANGSFRFANNRINAPISAAYVLDQINKGYQLNVTAQLQKDFNKTWFASVAYTYGKSKNIYDFRATTVAGSYSSKDVVGNTNLPVMAYSDFDQPHRVVGTLSYSKKYLKQLATTVSVLFEGAQYGRLSYKYRGNDVNNDGIRENELIFVPKDQSQINLVAYQGGGRTITSQEQWDALNNFISSSKYLNSRRGQFAERNGGILPWFFNADFKILQDIAFNIGGKTNSFQLSADVLNFTNLLNKNWGVRQIALTNKPIQAITPTTFQVDPNALKSTFVTDPGLDSRWRVQLGIRYNFN
jgi:outer membrane receptor protein involved in Fe transport